jgi:hypothetical protein
LFKVIFGQIPLNKLLLIIKTFVKIYQNKYMRLKAAPGFSGSVSGVRPQIPRQEQTRKSVLKKFEG